MIRCVIAVFTFLVFCTSDTNHSYGYACKDTPPKYKFLRVIRSPDAMSPNEQISTYAAPHMNRLHLFSARRKTYPDRVPSNDRNPEPASGSISSDKTISNDRQFSQDKQIKYPARLPSNEQRVANVKPGVVSNDRMTPSAPSAPTGPSGVSSEDVKTDAASRAATTDTPGLRQPSSTGKDNISDDELVPEWFSSFALITGLSVFSGVVFLWIFFRYGRNISHMFNNRSQTPVADLKTINVKNDLDAGIPLTKLTSTDQNIESD